MLQLGDRTALLQNPVEVIAFCDEEGIRRAACPCSGYKPIAISLLVRTNTACAAGRMPVRTHGSWRLVGPGLRLRECILVCSVCQDVGLNPVQRRTAGL